MKPFDDFLKTLKSLHEEYNRNTSNSKFNELNISEEDFKKIFPSLGHLNREDVTSHLLRFFRSESHVKRLTDAINKASGLEVTEEAQIKSITTVSEAINTYFEIGTESGGLESDLWIEAIEGIYKRQTPKHENPNLEREFLEGMKNGDCLQASWTYRDGDAEENENKYSDFHLVKRNGNYFLFCAKKDGNLVSSKLDNDQDILHQIHSIITTLDAFDENPQLKTVENIKQGRFIRTAEIESPVIRHAPFKEKILDDLLLKLNANANLEDEDKSLLLMISSFFIASQGVSENFQRPLNLDETKNLIRFLNNGLDAVEDPLFAARITLCDQDRLSSMSDLSRVFQEFFQGSQHAPFTKNKAVTIAAGREPSAEEKDDILSGTKYCFCKSQGGDHYFGLVFGEEIDRRRNIYIQDSTETINESIQSSYNAIIENIWPAETRGGVRATLIKTVKKRDNEQMFAPRAGIGIQNQCRYSAIVFSEQVIDGLKEGSRPSAGSIKYGEIDFMTRFARWFDESSLGKQATALIKEDDQVHHNYPYSRSMSIGGGEESINSDRAEADPFNPELTFEEIKANFIKNLKEVNLAIVSSLKHDQRYSVLTLSLNSSESNSYTDRIAGLIAKCEEQEKQLPMTAQILQQLEEFNAPPLPPHHHVLKAAGDGKRSFNPEPTFEKIKANFLKSGEQDEEVNLGILLSLTPEERDSVYTFSLSSYAKDSFSNRISKLIAECKKQEERLPTTAQILRQSEKAAHPPTPPTTTSPRDRAPIAPKGVCCTIS